MIRRLALLSILAVFSVFKLCAADSNVDLLQTLPGFTIEQILNADKAVNGSWICMARDPKGRLLLGGQKGQPVTRVTIKDGKVVSQDVMKLPVSETMGLLFVGDVLYANAWGKNNEGKIGMGLFRLKDSKGGCENFDTCEFLREWPGGSGEHGAHGIVLGPDKKLYMVCGNFTAHPADALPTSPHRNFQDDRILPRAEDGNGFGAGKKPPGGFVARMDLDGKNAELFCSGERNDYDIAFNPDGELFGYDSDMEWDWGAPWYRPTRAFHAVSGGDQGFREGSAKWPEYYFDSLPATANIGAGCPTGVIFGAGAKFPAKYQKAFYMLDWTYGRLLAVHLTPKGSGYSGTFENFVCPKGIYGNGVKTPLPLTDVVIGEDGAMYFTIGGRNNPAALYRVAYTGTEPTAAADLHDKEGEEARALRHKIEAFHNSPNPEALVVAWPNLGSDDRWIRYAARIAVERQPIDQWKAKALEEKNPRAALVALLALARYGTSQELPDLLAAANKFPFASLDETQQIDKLRLLQVAISRLGKPNAEGAAKIIAELNPVYPAKTVQLNTELCQILLALDAPDAVAKTVSLLDKAPTLEEQLVYAHHLRTITNGWNTELRKTYFSWWLKDRNAAQHPDEVVKWFTDAGRPYGEGNSLKNFVAQMAQTAQKNLSPEETAAVAEITSQIGKGTPMKAKHVSKARKLVKAWTMADLEPKLDQVGKARNFEQGKEVYEAANCIACHRFGNTGGAIGPELTTVNTRFKRVVILESIIEPSKVISEQLANTQIKAAGKVVEGRIIEENDERLILQPNPLDPEKLTIKKADITVRQFSKVSPMPDGLVNAFTEEEILDLIAYLESGGNKNHPDFDGGPKAPEKGVTVTGLIASLPVKDGKLSFKVTNELFGGDPVPNEPKHFRVDYTIDNEAGSKTVNENQDVEIIVPAGKKLTIKHAVYGVLK